MRQSRPSSTSVVIAGLAADGEMTRTRDALWIRAVVALEHGHVRAEAGRSRPITHSIEPRSSSTWCNNS